MDLEGISLQTLAALVSTGACILAASAGEMSRNTQSDRHKLFCEFQRAPRLELLLLPVMLRHMNHQCLEEVFVVVTGGGSESSDFIWSLLAH